MPCAARLWLTTTSRCASTSTAMMASREAFDNDSCSAALAHPGPTTGVALPGPRVAVALSARGRPTPGLRPDRYDCGCCTGASSCALDTLADIRGVATRPCPGRGAAASRVLVACRCLPADGRLPLLPTPHGGLASPPYRLAARPQDPDAARRAAHSCGRPAACR